MKKKSHGLQWMNQLTYYHNLRLYYTFLNTVPPDFHGIDTNIKIVSPNNIFDCVFEYSKYHFNYKKNPPIKFVIPDYRVIH